MQRIPVRLAAPLVCGIAVSLWFGGCTDRSRRSPLQPSGANEGLSSLTIEGPDSVAPGDRSTYAFIARFADGAVRDVTAEATWISAEPSIASVGAPGTIHGHVAGETRITAQFSNRGSHREIIVVPAGTYRLVGRVIEADDVEAPIPDVGLAVTDGVGAGIATTTDREGRYRIYGVAGSVVLRLSRDGYAPRDVPLVVDAHGVRDLELSLAGPRRQVAGAYTLRIDADATCADKFPGELRSRQYAVTLTQSGPELEARLAGNTFHVSPAGRGNWFRGRAEPAGVWFRLTPHVYKYYGYAQYPDLVEQLPNNGGYFVLDGEVFARESGSSFRGLLEGAYQRFEWDPQWGGTPTVTCEGAHPFVLTPAS